MAKNVHIHFKNGSSFRLGKVEYGSANANKRLGQLKKKQEEVSRAAKVDLETMRKVKFTL